MTTIQGARARNLISSVDFTIGDETNDVINVAIQLNGTEGAPLTEAVAVYAFLSPNATGLDVETSAPTDVSIGTDGAIIAELATDVAWLIQSEADGDIDLDITLDDPGVDTYHLVVVLPNGELAVSGAITFADQS